jgi:replicative DNA helicase
MAKVPIHKFEDLARQYIGERADPNLEPVRLGLGSLDARMRGVAPGQVCLVAARTGVGKTFMLGAILHNYTAREDSGCLVLSLEQPGPEWFERQFAIHEDIAHEQVEEWAKQGELGHHLMDFLERMRNVRLIEDSVQLENLVAAIESTRAELKVPLRLVMIDYLGLIGTTGRDAYERAARISRGLKRAAKQTHVAIVLAAQLSRQGGDGAEPVSLSMLRDSGTLEEDADFVIGMWRPGKAQDLGPADYDSLKNVLRVSLLKNRKGVDGQVIDLLFRPDSRRVYDPQEPFAVEVEM